MLPALHCPAVHTAEGLAREISQWRADGHRVGFVPTMGALHEGHIALVLKAMEVCDRVVVSIFVNPTQFAAHEDLGTYPRTLEADSALLAAAGCHLLYAPSVEEVYPDGFSTTVSVEGPSIGLESDARPHFFAGVATVVARLFGQVRPDIAVFGEKDYQQLMVIRRMVSDLALPVTVLGVETKREADGLALSSRNVYLSPAERMRAGRLNVILRDLAHALEDGEPAARALEHARILASSVFDAVDYIEVRDADRLEIVGEGPLARPARVLAAVRVGKTRLIDNVPANPARRG
ncbi:pantoate--beta-alanine ligase [Glycocaulis sp.]|uniref:pantoate--beta-alanine ligase n=1 Tax=Glycocaulis sp. TaxID=1969725 RepID=UPI003D206EFC